MRLIISDASEDDLDITPILLARQADIRFFIPEGKDEFFLNMETVLGAELPKITVPIYRLGKTYTDKNSEGFEEMYYYFRWRYAEPASALKGTAMVNLKFIFKPQGISFAMKVAREDLKILLYKGFVEGTLNLNVYED